MITLSDNVLLVLLTQPGWPYRLLRHGLLWGSALLLLDRGFRYIAPSMNCPTPDNLQRYVGWATAVFGGLILIGYFVITWLAYQFILRRSQPGRFLAGLLGFHLIASGFVWSHFLLFYKLFSPNQLPGFYAQNKEHLLGLAFWQIPFDLRLVWLFSFSLFYNYLLYAVGFKVFKDLFTLQLLKTRLEKENLRLEFEFLRAQVNPHFLFNTLNNLYSFAVRTPERVADPLLKLAQMLRYTLYETATPLVPLTSELDFLRGYIDLQRLRFEADVVIDLRVDGQPTDQQLAPLLLITFVENAFKHGLQATTQAGWVQIALRIQADALHLRIENSLPPFPRPTPPGLGLLNARRRLTYHYPGSHSLRIQPGPASYCVELTLILSNDALHRTHRR